MEKDSQISHVDVIRGVPANVRDFLGAVVKLNERGIYHEPSCPICSSQFRDEAERIFLTIPKYEDDKYEKTKEFLDGQGDVFSIDVVKNHCNNHVNQGESQLRKIEYINTLSNISSVKLSTLEEIDVMLSAIKERMIEAAKIGGDKRTSKIDAEVLRSNIIAQLSKSLASLLKLRAELLGEMQKNGEVIVISRQKFKQLFNSALDSAKNDDEKNAIINLLRNLSKLEDKDSS